MPDLETELYAIRHRAAYGVAPDLCPKCRVFERSYLVELDGGERVVVHESDMRKDVAHA